ncbi:choice-of-anchor Q domain-containing protein [Niabella yanshanensis]|uniref:Choice-of-anchor Q domain-containing protein n=1 Tax=Niabella yanshanensis TaxID=577386 RepID=A0ABZ0W6C6_9BACT|nr:choice-of-anchor Q domain-containing protein [Niabella yanshanensis]WQD38067.1 choice-of-anchor Q domain-containing protein [Niabella yanshanensis]
MKKIYSLLLFSLCYTAILQAQITPSAEKILYVKKNVSGGTGNGSSWANAVPELADALKWAREQYIADDNWLAGDSLRIFIAEGTYKPLYDADNSRFQNDGGRDNAFVAIDRVHLYGGFPATGNPGMNERNWKTYPTILSGDIGVPNDYADNVYHVLITVNLQNTRIDGLRITGGMANAPSLQTAVSIKSTNIGHTRNGGGGLFAVLDSNTLKVSNVEISGNRADYAGGGDIRSALSLSNITVRDNIATEWGGGFYFAAMGPTGSYTLTNTLFTGNTAKYGGAIISQINALALVNTTIVNNTASLGGHGIYHRAIPGAQITLANSIVWNSAPNAVRIIDSLGGAPFDISFSIVQTATVPAGTGNFNSDPLFTDLAGGDFTLSDASPGINGGSNQFWNSANNTEILDLAGNPRIAGSAIDMGVFESQTVLPVLFGNWSAAIKNGQLVFDWSTEAEVNNDHFLIQVSQDGIKWTTVQKIPTLAAGGNSSIPLTYQSSIPLTSLSLGMGLFFLASLAFKGRRRMFVMITPVLLFVLIVSCNKKETLSNIENGKLFARLVQVDKDGITSASKIIQVMQE